MKAKYSDRERLEQRLAALAEHMDFSQKQVVKASLLEKFELEKSTWLAKMRVVGQEFVLAPTHRFLMKEMLMTVVRSTRWSWPNFGEGLKWSTAASLVVVLVFTVILGPWFGLERADASEISYIQNIDGDVKILRGEQELVGEKGLAIQQADQIVVGTNSVVELRFVNDNLVRFRENSKLVLEKLDAVTPTQSVVSLNLVDGEGWFKVFAIGGKKAEFKVNTDKVLVSATQESAFDIKNTEDRTRVVAINNSLDMILSHNQQLLATTLPPEYMVHVRANTPFVSYQERLKFVEKVQNEDLDWFERNLLADKWYKIELQGRLRDAIALKAGLTPDNPFYSLKQFKRKARLALTFDDVKKEEIRLDIAKEKFYEAHKSLNDGNTKLAKTLLDDFEKETVEISKKVDELAIVDPKKVEDIKVSLTDGLIEQKHSLAGLVDNTSLATAKDSITKVETATEKEVAAVPEDELKAGDVVEEVVDVPVVHQAILEEANVNFDLAKLEVRLENVTDLREVKEKAGVPEDQLEVEPIVVEPKPVVKPSTGVVIEAVVFD